MAVQDSLEDYLKSEFKNQGASTLLRELSTWDILNRGNVPAADQEGHVLASSLVSRSIQYIYGTSADGADAVVKSAEQAPVHQRFSEAFRYITAQDAGYGNLVLSSLSQVAHYLSEDRIKDWIDVGIGVRTVTDLSYLTDKERAIIAPMPSPSNVKEVGKYIINYFALKDGSAGKNLFDILQGKMPSMNLTAPPGGLTPVPGTSASGAAAASATPSGSSSAAASGSPAPGAAPASSSAAPAASASAPTAASSALAKPSLKDILLGEFQQLDHSGILKVPPQDLEQYAEDIVKYAVPLRGEGVIHDVAQKAKDLEKYNIKFPFAFLSSADVIYNQLDRKHVGEFIRRGLEPYLDYQKLSPDKQQKSGVYTEAVDKVVGFFGMDKAGEKVLQELKVKQQKEYDASLSTWKSRTAILGVAAAAFLGFVAYLGYAESKNRVQHAAEMKQEADKIAELRNSLDEAASRFKYADYKLRNTSLARVEQALKSDDPAELQRVVDSYLKDTGGELIVYNAGSCAEGVSNLYGAMGLRRTGTVASFEKFIDQLTPVYCPDRNAPDDTMYMRFKLNKPK